MSLFWIPFTLISLCLFGALVLMNVDLWWLGLFLAVDVGFGAAWVFRHQLRAWSVRKVAEWRNDAKQLGLWTRLAFTRQRSPLETAAMTHQMQFLQGRIMSPMNLFLVATIALLLAPLTFVVQEWRIAHIKAQARAECSDREMTRTAEGRFNTDRQACADLGAQRESALQWRTRAIEAEAARIRDVAMVREENRLAAVAEQQRRVRAAALTERVRRRQDETITAALGGPSPDLERSMCELARGGECSAAEPAGAVSVAPPASSLHAGTGNDSASNATDAPP